MLKCIQESDQTFPPFATLMKETFLEGLLCPRHFTFNAKHCLAIFSCVHPHSLSRLYPLCMCSRMHARISWAFWCISAVLGPDGSPAVSKPHSHCRKSCYLHEHTAIWLWLGFNSPEEQLSTIHSHE